jgi:hypothetical protein
MEIPVARPHYYLSLSIDLELYLMTGLKPQTIANLFRDGDLSLAGYGADYAGVHAPYINGRFFTSP